MMMQIIIFLYSLLFGSFLNVVGLRVPQNKSIIRPRSACSSCNIPLTYKELIPVLSYIFQFGKCRNCNQRISPLYPIMELTTACLFLFAYLTIGWSFELLIAWSLISLLIIVFISDICFMLVPDKILSVFSVIFLILRIIKPLTPWWESLAGASIAFVLLLVIAVISNGGMGGGDIKLYAVLGFVLGVEHVLTSFIFATFIGAIVGLIGMAIGVVERKKPIPFAPFIVIGTLIIYFSRDYIFTWYFQLY